MPDSKQSLPKLNELCSELGFGEKEQQEFLSTTERWRVRYISENSADENFEKELRRWDPPSGNHALKQMARRFLEHGFGGRFWPVEYGARLQYHDNTDELIEILYKLFYWQNLNAFKRRSKGETGRSVDVQKGDGPSSANQERGPRPDLSDASMDRRYAHPSTEHRVANFPNEQRPPERVTGNLGRSRPVGSYTGDIVDRSRPFQPFAAQAQNINHGFGPFKLHSQDPQSSTPPKRPTPLLDYFSSSRSDAALMTNDDAHFPRTKVMSKTHIYRDSNGETSTTYNDRQIDKRNLSTVSTIEDSEPKRLRSKPYSAPVTDGIVGFDTETPVITEQPSSTSAHAQSTQRPKSQSRSCAPCRKAKVGCDKKEPCNSCRRKGRQNGEYRLTARCCLRRHAFQQPKAKEDVACIYPNAVGTGKTSARKTNPHDSPDPSNATMDSGSGSSYRDREGDLERRNRTKPENTSSRRKTRSALAAGKDATSKLPPSVEGTVNNIWDSNAGGQLPSDLDITTNHSLPIAIPSSSPSRPVSEDRESEAVAHFIVVVTDRRVQKRWLTGSLTGGTLPRLLQEISAYTPGRPILKIMCTLSTSHEGLDDVEYEIKKDDGRMFSEMVREFRSRIAEGERKRITHFRILWEPVFGEQTSI